jgi:hypothetical protein
VEVDCAVIGSDPRAFLAPVLQRVQAEDSLSRSIRRMDPDDTALVASPTLER